MSVWSAFKNEFTRRAANLPHTFTPLEVQATTACSLAVGTAAFMATGDFATSFTTGAIGGPLLVGAVRHSVNAAGSLASALLMPGRHGGPS